MERSPRQKTSDYRMPLVLLLTMILLSAIPTYVFGENNDSVVTSGFCGSQYGNGDFEDLSWSFDNGTLTISGSGSMQDYDNYDPPWYPLKESINTVLIDEGVDYISNYAFVHAYNLETVSIPDTVSGIGWGAFSNCIHLTNIEFPDSVFGIGDHAFENCTGLQNVVLNDNLYGIGTFAFASCTGLKSITIPDSVTFLEWDAFYGCNSLETVHIGSSFNNYGLSSWDYEVNPQNHDNHMDFLSGLIDSKALKSISVSSDNLVLKAVDGVLFDVTGEVLVRYPKQKPNSTYCIPEGVKTIYRRAFEDCSYLEQIVFPESLECIREEAFCGCSSLKVIDIPNGAKFENLIYAYGDEPVPHRCFKDCVALQTAALPQLSENIFEGCKNLKNVTIRINSTEEWYWPKHAFLNCFALERIDLEGNINKTFLFPEALEEFGEAFIYGYDFIIKNNVESEEKTEVKLESDSSCPADYFEYYDENNPFCDLFILDKPDGGICVIHQDGSISGVFPEWAEDTLNNWRDIKQVACTPWTIVGLKNNGTLVYVDSDSYYDTTSDTFIVDPITQWRDIEKIILLDGNWGVPYCVALTEDGRVVSQCYWLCGQLLDWNDIVDLICLRSYGDPYELHLVGVRRDGTLCSINNNVTWLGATDHVVSIKMAYPYDLIAINDDGTIVETSGLAESAFELSQWKDIKQIECIDDNTFVGLRNDGTLVATGGRFPEIRSWDSVSSIVFSGSALYAVDVEGNVLESGNSKSHAGWKNVEKLFCFDEGLVGVTYDGRLISDFELGF